MLSYTNVPIYNTLANKSVKQRISNGAQILNKQTLKASSLINKLRCGQKITNTLSCPPTSQTVKLTFLYSTVSTLKPNPSKVYVQNFNHFHLALVLYKIIILESLKLKDNYIYIGFLNNHVTTNCTSTRLES